MSKFDEYVNASGKKFDFNGKELPFIKLSELLEKSGEGPYTIRALWIAKPSKKHIDPHPVIVIDGYNVDLPAHKNGDVEDFLGDPGSIDMINKGLAAFRIVKYANDFGEFCSVAWCKNDTNMPFEV